jgi:hypothetical protein
LRAYIKPLTNKKIGKSGTFKTLKADPKKERTGKGLSEPLIAPRVFAGGRSGGRGIRLSARYVFFCPFFNGRQKPPKKKNGAGLNVFFKKGKMNSHLFCGFVKTAKVFLGAYRALFLERPGSRTSDR